MKENYDGLLPPLKSPRMGRANSDSRPNREKKSHRKKENVINL